MPSSRAPARKRRAMAALAALALVTSLAGSAVAAPGGNGKAGFKTSIQAMLMPGDQAPAGVVIDPIVTVGDSVKGFTFDSLPDGISFVRHGNGTVDLYVNHETSLVPFPLPPTVPVQVDDFTNSHVDLLRLNQGSAGVLNGADVIPSDANYQRFCSNFLAGPAQGFDRQILFTNEEATDFVYREGVAWPVNEPADPRVPEQAGVVVALDIKTGEYRSIYGMGRHNHENSVAIPGYEQLVVLSGDDTFNAPASQLYSYIADDTDQLLDDEGSLFAFRSDITAINDYGDLPASVPVSGQFIPVPPDIARGKDAAGNEITAPVAPPAGILPGPQWALEYWSNQNNVFQFIRVEDIAYDRNDPHIVYFADTGEPRAIPDATTGRLRRGSSSTRGAYPNGRIFKMVLNEENPLRVDSLSVLIDGDAGGYNNPLALHQPDNIETTANSILIQEDPGSHNHFALSDPAGVGARIWRYDLTDGSLEAVIEVDQSLDGADPNYDKGGGVAARGAWESSGIIDASSIWGPGWFLVDVQAGSLVLESTTGTLGGQTVQFEREGGQLLRVKIPGS